MQRHTSNQQREQLLERLTDKSHAGALPRDNQEQLTGDDEPLETIHVYFVREDEAQQETPVVESTVQAASSIPAAGNTQPLATKPYPTHIRLVPSLMMAAHLLIVLFALSAYLYISLTESATITIMPKSYHLSARLTLANVKSRVFHPITLTQSRTVPATGTGHKDATVATGTITLYNAATQAQTIDAGTLFIGSDGVHVITDQPAYIPGAIPPTEGQTTVTAHAVNKGAAGNIHAGDIQGACCRENMFAYNRAFSGGQDARDYTIVTKRDIHSVVSTVLPLLTQRIQTAYHEQLRPGEILAPTQCSQNIAPDHHVGDETTQVMVMVSESCRAGAYTTTDLQTKVQQALTQQAEQTRGKGYLLASYSQTSPTQATIQQGRLVIGGTFERRMIYHFSTRELTTLRQQLAGKTSQQGTTILSHLSCVDHLTVQIGKSGTFPTDPTHIHILFLQVP